MNEWITRIDDRLRELGVLLEPHLHQSVKGRAWVEPCAEDPEKLTFRFGGFSWSANVPPKELLSRLEAIPTGLDRSQVTTLLRAILRGPRYEIETRSLNREG